MFIGEGSQVATDKEHLIGKNFVPPHCFDGGQKFNFLFRACRCCNTDKSKLEGHVSSVTLINTPARSSDPAVDARALEKAQGEFHPDTKRRIAKSGEQFQIGSEPISFGFASPPQLNRQYANRLALRHVQGLYSLFTSSDPLVASGIRLLPPDHCWILGCFTHRDWGNPQLLELIRRTGDWQCYPTVNTADSFFKAILKREAVDQRWFWALEWNKSIRVCGTIAPPGDLPRLFADLPQLEWRNVLANASNVTRIREEVPLPQIEDRLFASAVIREQ